MHFNTVLSNSGKVSGQVKRLYGMIALVCEDEKSVTVIEIGFKAFAICCLTPAGWEATHWQLTGGLGCFKSAAPKKT